MGRLNKKVSKQLIHLDIIMFSNIQTWNENMIF